MEIIKIPLNKLYIPKDDYKITEDVLVTKLANVLSKFGQLTPLLVQKDDEDRYKIIDGSRIFIASIKLKLKTLDCVVVPDKFDVEDGDLLRVIYGQFSFDYDVVKLISLMCKIMDKYDINDLEYLLPYNKEELENYQKLFDFDWNTFSQVNKKSNKKKLF